MFPYSIRYILKSITNKDEETFFYNLLNKR